MEENGKRMVADTGYEVKQAMRIGGKEILLAENLNAEDGQFYLVATCRERGFLMEYSNPVTDDNYLDAVQDFVGRIVSEVEAIRAELTALNLPAAIFTKEHCHPHDYGVDIVGKVVAIKAEILSPEYRRGDVQLVYVTGGNGARGGARGNAVYCNHLNNGEHTRFDRRDVLGVVRSESLPQWAKENLARLQGEKEKPAAEKEFAGRYEISERMEVGQKVFALGHCAGAVQPYGTWQSHKTRKGDFDIGHYFSDYDTAKEDLRERAANEQQRIERPKRREDGAR